MSTFSWSPYLGDTLWYDNLTHNRLNFAYYPNDEFSVFVEMRNRLFLGSNVNKIPDYDDIVNNNNDIFTLSFNAIDTDNAILNIMFDRLFVQWVKNDWEVKLGRQRINWGVNLAWNPNDWFNAYSFYDFDYEERPGSDAVRVTYYTGVASSIEVASKLAYRVDDYVAAGMYKINKGNYDIQFLGGLAQGDVSLGAGWAGSLGMAGFKGEMTYFIPVIETAANTIYIPDGNGNNVKYGERYSSMYLGSITVDYSFKNSLYLNGAVMYNTNGSYDANLFGSAVGQQIGRFTVRDLSPFPWSTFVQATYQFSPLLFGGGALMYYPGTNNFFINPMLAYSIIQNLDVDVVGQLFFGNNQNGSYDAVSKSVFLRLKWSF